MFDWPDIGFIWPRLLWLLLIVPVSVLIYLRARRRVPTTAITMLTGALVTVGVFALLAAIARPQLELSLPMRVDRLMIVMDISGSMRADDVKPSRFDAAKQSVLEMIDQQPAALRVGLVTVAATATLVQAPTTDRDALLTTLNGISLQTGSALGSGVLIGLSELLPSAGIDVQAIINASLNPENQARGLAWKPSPVLTRPPGSNQTVAMLLLSDGESNMGPNVLQMAELASQFGVRIYTVGVGTRQGAVVRAEGVAQRVRLDHSLLAQIAQTTVGTYYEGASRDELRAIYDAIQANVQFERKQSLEVSAPLVLIGLLLVLIGMGMSFARQARIL
jgi:Ca-activated chloride channel homolog